MSRATLSIKKDDMVQVISGRDASSPGRVKRGRVLRVLPGRGGWSSKA